MNVHDEKLVKRNWKCDICSDVLFAKKSLMLEHYAEKHTEEFAELQRRLDNQAGDRELLQDDDEAVGNPFKQSKKRRLNEVKLVRSEIMLENYLSEGKGAIDLLLNTAGRKLRCTFDKCYRTFKTEERLQKHIDRHKIHQLKLKVLQEKAVLKENQLGPRNDETGVREDNVNDGMHIEADSTTSASKTIGLM